MVSYELCQVMLWTLTGFPVLMSSIKRVIASAKFPWKVPLQCSSLAKRPGGYSYPRPVRQVDDHLPSPSAAPHAPRISAICGKATHWSGEATSHDKSPHSPCLCKIFARLLEQGAEIEAEIAELDLRIWLFL